MSRDLTSAWLLLTRYTQTFILFGWSRFNIYACILGTCYAPFHRWITWVCSLNMRLSICIYPYWSLREDSSLLSFRQLYQERSTYLQFRISNSLRNIWSKTQSKRHQSCNYDAHQKLEDYFDLFIYEFDFKYNKMGRCSKGNPRVYVDFLI